MHASICTMALDLSTAELPEIAAHYAAPHSPWLRANMVISSDGKFVGSTGTSRDLTNALDLQLLLLLRAMSDVVLVGANTARNESYRQPKLRPEFAFLGRRAPRLALVTRSLNFDIDSVLFHGGASRTIVFHTGDKVPSKQLQEVAELIPVNSTTDVIAKLHEMHLPLITCEGGPNLLGQLLAADLVDEYDLTVSPVLSGNSSESTGAEVDLEHWQVLSSATADDFTFLRHTRRA